MHSVLVRRLLFICLLVSPLTAPTEERPRSPISIPDFSTVVATPDIKEPLTNAQLNTCIREAARIMKVEDQARPQIVVLQLSPPEAKRLGLTQTTLLSNKGKSGPGAFYEVWIVGSYALGDLARGIEMVYELHYGFNYSDVERGKLVKRLAEHLNSTVSVNALRDENQSR